MTDSTISAMPPASLPLSDEAVPCVQDGDNVQAPAAAFGIPIASMAAPEPLADYQTWIDQSTTPPTLRMYVGGAWKPIYQIGSDGKLTFTLPLTLAGDPTSNNHAATKHYVDQSTGVPGAMIFKGVIDCSGNPNYPAADLGHVYVVSVGGKIGGANGAAVEASDTLLCRVNGTSAGTQTSVGGNWTIGQGNLDGMERPNLLVNSAFDVWQENISYALTPTNKVFVADFWKASAQIGGAATHTVSRVSGLANAQYAVKCQRPSGDTSTGRFRLAQQFGQQEAMFLAGKTVTVSFDFAKGTTYTPTLGPFVTFFCGTGVDEDIDLHQANPVFATGGSSVSSALTSQVPGAAGTVVRMVTPPIAIPAGITELAFAIESWAFNGTASTDDSFTIGNVKMEIGNVATPYRKPDAGDELRRCQRRYWKTFLRTTVPAQGAGSGTGEFRAAATKAGANAQTLGTVHFPPMRAAPAAALFNPVSGGASGQVRDLTAAADCTSTAVQNVSESSCEIVTTGNASTALGNTLGIHLTLDARL